MFECFQWPMQFRMVSTLYGSHGTDRQYHNLGCFRHVHTPRSDVGVHLAAVVDCINCHLFLMYAFLDIPWPRRTASQLHELWTLYHSSNVMFWNGSTWIHNVQCCCYRRIEFSRANSCARPLLMSSFMQHSNLKAMSVWVEWQVLW